MPSLAKSRSNGELAPAHAPLPATSRQVAAAILRPNAAAEPIGRAVAEEVPVNIVYDNLPYAVMMATPADLQDFAYGFSLTEGIVTRREDILSAQVETAPNGLRLVIGLGDRAYRGVLDRRRSITGRTSCGICGIETLSSLPVAARRPPAPMAVQPASIWRALAALSQHQPLNAATRAVHAAAWIDPEGAILYLREDVGRHNALDKLLGALLRNAVPPDSGFLLVTSRCSYEMVEKAAAFGAGALVAISAPTSLGIDRAWHHGISLIGIARQDAMTIFTGPGAIPASPAADPGE